MTRETRIALLVGLVFIVLFGLVLGRRSLSRSVSSRPAQPATPNSSSAPSRPAPEVITGLMFEGDNRSVLSHEARSHGPSAPAQPAVRQTGDESGERPAATPPESAQRPNPPLPSVAPPLRTYRVQSGDTLIRIARKVYGRGGGNQYLRIYRANRDKLSDPTMVSIGQVLVIPPLREGGRAVAPQPRRVASRPPGQRHYTEMTLKALGNHFSHSRTYTVRAGDCLTGIARKTMGSGSRATVQKLLNANRNQIENPDRLTIGLKLKIPG